MLLCMRKFYHNEKISFDKFTEFLTVPLLEHSIYKMMVKIAHFVKLTSLRA